MNAYNNMIANAAKINKNSVINPVNNPGLNKKTAQVNESQSSFTEVLQDKLSEMDSLQFSKHAALRINSRDINLSSDQLKRVEEGVVEAKQKGIKDSLVLVDNVALVVNIPSKTVVTAINQNNQSIFTNIDGTVIV